VARRVTVALGLRRAAVVAALLAGSVLGPGPGAPRAHAATFQSLDSALAQAFPGARIEQRMLALSQADVKAVEARARAKCATRLAAAYVAWRGDTLAGVGWTDRRVIRTREAVLLVAVSPDTSIARIEVLGFAEPPDYLPPARWLGLFRGRGPRKPLTAQRTVPNLAGATLTSRAVNESARLALAWYEVLLAPGLATPSRNAETRPPTGGDKP
jgi:hypothetical protein